jgi:choline dehydrogenase
VTASRHDGGIWMEYDFIIVGAGSSGCALAERLSRKHNVLLLEAGTSNRSPFVSMPSGWARLWENPRYFWLFPIEAERGRPPGERWAYGKGLGGSSAVNGTTYFRGQAADYDQWRKHGNGEWSWAEMLRVFSEMEDFHGPSPDPSRGLGGPVEITELSDHSPVIHAVIAAAEGAGLPFILDVNGERRHGIGFTQATVDRRGRRVSAYTAFLARVRGRRTLAVRTDVLVQRVTFEGQRATGVEGTEGGMAVRYRARREVILCAGVMNSPKLLQLSGVGPGAVLERHKVPVIVDAREVGRNLIEHIMLAFSYRMRNAHGKNREFHGLRMLGNILRYYLRGTGVLTAATTELTAFLSLQGRPDWPEMQLGISPFSFDNSPELKAEVGRGVPEFEPGITVTAFHCRPRSRGTIELRSRDAIDAPAVHANWLTDEEDRRMVVALVRAVRGLMRRRELSDYAGEELVPGAIGDSDEDILRWSMANLSSGLHGTGTCRMGAPGEGVVSARLTVHGVEGLRVADCSVMPTAISGNTNGPAMAVGYRAGELILEDNA